MIAFINYMNYSLSVIIPVYMEAENVRDAVRGAIKATESAGIKEYEIIIIDCLRKDGSHDGTPDIADEIASIIPKVRVIHNKSYVNLGYKYFQGVKNAKYDYITWIPGDNENLPESITETYKLIGKTDVVIPYTSNMEVRPFFRQAVSKFYTFINNLFFGLNLKNIIGTIKAIIKLFWNVRIKKKRISVKK